MDPALQLAVSSLLLNNYTTLVMLTAVGYDYILTFSSEMEYIWNKPWTWVSTLFVLVRCFGLFSVAIFATLGSSFLPGPVKLGNILDTIGAWTTITFIAAVDMVMILRVWALYNQSRIVLGALLLLWAMEVIPYLVVCIISSIHWNTLEDIAQVLDFTFCVAQFGSPGWGVTIDIVQVTLGALMCLLVTIQFVRQTLQMYKATKQLQPSQYLSLFMREGMFYFFAILTYAVINVLYFTTNMPFDQGWIVLITAIEFVPAFTVAPRLILSLRALYARDARGRLGGDIDTAFGLAPVAGHSTAVTTMMFAEAGQNAAESQSEEIQMEERNMRSTDWDP